MNFEEVQADRRALLQTMIEENLEHARHLENERLTFNSIYIAIVAGVLAFAFNLETPFLSMCAMAVLFYAGVVGLLLTKRWSDVYEEHMLTAEGLAQEIFGDDVQKYYYFHHDYQTKERQNFTKKQTEKQTRLAARGITYQVKSADTLNFNGFYQRLCQIHTRRLFNLFYCMILLVLAVLFILCLLKIFHFL